MATVALNAAPLKGDLYARTTTNNEQELSVGENVIGDILPAIWRYDIAATNTDDFTNGVIQPTSITGMNPGRWIRVFVVETSTDLAAAISTLNTSISSKFTNPTGSNVQYIAGDGSLISFPFIPTKISDLTNDSTFVESASLATVATSGSYTDLSNQPADLPPSGAASGDLTGTYPNPTIANGVVTDTKIVSMAYSKLTGAPTNLSAFTNGPGYLTAITGTQVTAALGFTPVSQSGARSAIALTTTGTGAATYNNSTGALNIPVPVAPVIYNAGGVVNQAIKIWSANVTPSTASGYSVDISAAGFSTILSATVTAQSNTATVNSIPIASIKTVGTSAIVVNIVSSQTTGVLLGGNIQGLNFIASLTGVTLNVTVIGY